MSVTIEPPELARAVAAMDRGDADALAAMLRANPTLLTLRATLAGEHPGSYFEAPRLMWFLAENPIRTGAMPGNIGTVLDTLIAESRAAGIADLGEVAGYTLALVASGRVARQSGHQAALIRKLVDAGAEPDGAMRAALGHGELAAARALRDAGARADLVYCAATGDGAALRAQLPGATEADLQAALAAASINRQAAGVAALLAHGADPDRLCPAGFHPHATPLHQVAWNGDRATAEVFVTAGADLGIRDIHHDATPASWAAHAGHADLADFLTPSA